MIEDLNKSTSKRKEVAQFYDLGNNNNFCKLKDI